MKLLKNTCTQCVCFAGFFLMIGGCAASSTAPVTAQSTGPTYECEAGDTSWECRAQGTEIETSVAPTPRTAPAEVEQSQPENRSWWRIRTRGSESSGASSRDKPKVATAEKTQPRIAARAQPRTVAKTDAPKRERRGFFNIRVRGRDSASSASQAREEADTNPAQVVDSSAASIPTPTVTQTTPRASISTRPSERLSPKPTGTSSRQTTSQRPNVTPTTTARQPVVVVQVPRSNTSESTTARRVASTTNPDVPLDGLGRDYDYAVQLAAFTNYGLSSDFLNSYPSLDLMRVKTQSKGKTFYIVLAGTFESKNLASAQSQMLTSTYGMDEPYIRTVKSIRNVQIN